VRPKVHRETESRAGTPSLDLLRAFDRRTDVAVGPSEDTLLAVKDVATKSLVGAIDIGPPVSDVCATIQWEVVLPRAERVGIGEKHARVIDADDA